MSHRELWIIFYLTEIIPPSMASTRRSQGAFSLRNLALYTLLAYGFSWLLWLPQVLASNGLTRWDTFSYLVGFVAPFGPSLAAFAVTYFTEGRESTLSLLRRGTMLGFRRRWLVALLLFSPLWAGSVFLVGSITEGVPISLPWLSNPLSLIASPGIYNLAYLLVFFGVAEEFGWRGYALEKIQGRLGSAALSAVVVGLMWTFWHTPLFYVAGSSMATTGLVPQVAQTVVFSIWLTWFYNNTGGSVLATIFFHAWNALTLFVIFPVSYVYRSGSLPSILLYVLAALITIVILVVWWPKSLLRDRNGNGSHRLS